MLERLGSPLARSKRDALLAFEGVEGDVSFDEIKVRSR